MSSSFGLTTTKMKQLLSQLKKKFVVVPRVNSYKLVDKKEESSTERMKLADKVERKFKSTERKKFMKEEDLTSPI